MFKQRLPITRLGVALGLTLRAGGNHGDDTTFPTRHVTTLGHRPGGPFCAVRDSQSGIGHCKIIRWAMAVFARRDRIDRWHVRRSPERHRKTLQEIEGLVLRALPVEEADESDFPRANK